MTRATPNMRDFAGNLIVHEANGHRRSRTKTGAALRVCEKLRPPLTTLMGHAGFQAVLSRALALASAEQPVLRRAHVRPDGTLAGLDEPQAQVSPRTFTEEEVVLVAQLLGLLAALIGEELSRRIVSQTWPDLHHTDSRQPKEKNEEA